MAWRSGLGTFVLVCSLGSSLAVGTVPPAPPVPSVQGPPAESPHRIISLVPAVTEMVFAMGAGDAVVGVSNYDHYPPAVETRMRVGALIDPDFERILALRPDLVVVYGTQSDLVDRLSHAHVPMFHYAHAGLADITQTMRALGARLGHAQDAGRAAEAIERDLADIRASVANRPHPRTALIFGREPGALRAIFASGGTGFLHDMLDAAGGRDVFADVKEQNLQASAEMLLARAPEVILEVRPTEDWTPDLVTRERAVWRQLPSLPAVRANRIYFLADNRLVIPGPRVAEGVRIIARALQGPQGVATLKPQAKAGPDE